MQWIRTKALDLAVSEKEDLPNAPKQCCYSPQMPDIPRGT